MSKREQHRFVLSDYKDTKRREGAIHIDAGEKTFVIDPPELWSDEALASAENPLKIGPLVMGEEAFAEFVEAGGSGGILLSMIGDVHGVSPGE